MGFSTQKGLLCKKQAEMQKALIYPLAHCGIIGIDKRFFGVA